MADNGCIWPGISYLGAWFKRSMALKMDMDGEFPTSSLTFICDVSAFLGASYRLAARLIAICIYHYIPDTECSIIIRKTDHSAILELR